jgi:two-component system KDP operon response regulator KdpE
MKLLIIEDDPEIQEIISICFEMSWPAAKVVSSLKGKRGVELSESEKPDIIVLDLGLPDINGFEVLKEIRSFSNIPIIILSVRGREQDKIKGLELGADDYVVKPFSPTELLARVRAVLRRSKALPLNGPSINLGELTINHGARKATLGGKEIGLTPTEYNLLYFLAMNGGRVLTREVLLSKLWGEEYLDSPGCLKTCIQRLRGKIEKDPKNPKVILTQKGGYMLSKPTS